MYFDIVIMVAIANIAVDAMDTASALIVCNVIASAYILMWARQRETWE